MYEVESRLECCAYAGGKLVLRNDFASYLENIGEECRLAVNAGQGDARVEGSGKWLLLLRNGESQRFPTTRDHFRKRVNWAKVNEKVVTEWRLRYILALNMSCTWPSFFYVTCLTYIYFKAKIWKNDASESEGNCIFLKHYRRPCQPTYIQYLPHISTVFRELKRIKCVQEMKMSSNF